MSEAKGEPAVLLGSDKLCWGEAAQAAGSDDGGCDDGADSPAHVVAAEIGEDFSRSGRVSSCGVRAGGRAGESFREGETSLAGDEALPVPGDAGRRTSLDCPMGGLVAQGFRAESFFLRTPAPDNRGDRTSPC